MSSRCKDEEVGGTAALSDDDMEGVMEDVDKYVGVSVPRASERTAQASSNRSADPVPRVLAGDAGAVSHMRYW